MPSPWSKSGRKCYITAIFSCTQKRADMLHHPCILWDPQRQPRKEPKVSSGPKQRGTKSELAASPLPTRGPKIGPKCYVTRAFSGIPNAKRG